MQKLEIENSFLNSSSETLFCLLCAAGNDKKAKKAIEKRVRPEKKKQSKNVLLEGDLEMMLTQRASLSLRFLGNFDRKIASAMKQSPCELMFSSRETKTTQTMERNQKYNHLLLSPAPKSRQIY